MVLESVETIKSFREKVFSKKDFKMVTVLKMLEMNFGISGNGLEKSI